MTWGEAMERYVLTVMKPKTEPSLLQNYLTTYKRLVAELGGSAKHQSQDSGRVILDQINGHTVSRPRGATYWFRSMKKSSISSIFISIVSFPRR